MGKSSMKDLTAFLIESEEISSSPLFTTKRRRRNFNKIMKRGKGRTIWDDDSWFFCFVLLSCIFLSCFLQICQASCSERCYKRLNQFCCRTSFNGACCEFPIRDYDLRNQLMAGNSAYFRGLRRNHPQRRKFNSRKFKRDFEKLLNDLSI